jgi:hypothetical protein
MGSYQEFCQTTMQETIWCMRCPHCHKRWGGAFCEAWISEQVFQPAQPAPARIATRPFCHRCDGTIKEPSISFHPKCLADYVEGQQIVSSQPTPAGQELREDPLEHVRKILDSDNDWEDRQAAVYSYLDLQRLATPNTLRERLEGLHRWTFEEGGRVKHLVNLEDVRALLASAPAPAVRPEPICCEQCDKEITNNTYLCSECWNRVAPKSQPAPPVEARARYEEWRNSRWAGLGYVRNLDNDLWDGWQAAEQATMERAAQEWRTIVVGLPIIRKLLNGEDLSLETFHVSLIPDDVLFNAKPPAFAPQREPEQICSKCGAKTWSTTNGECDKCSGTVNAARNVSQ